MIEIQRYHDICFGHRVYGHENKCAHLHGHNYRFTFTIRPEESLDSIGRVLDFSVIKTILCQWLEDNWDHKMMLYSIDPIRYAISDNDFTGLVIVPFNPTAENIAEYFLNVVAPPLLKPEYVFLYSVKVEETRKCSATAILDPNNEARIRAYKQEHDSEQPF